MEARVLRGDGRDGREGMGPKASCFSHMRLAVGYNEDALAVPG